MNTLSLAKFLVLATAALALFLPAGVVVADNAGKNWSGAWRGSTPASRTVQIITADQIEKKKSGFYDRVGTVTAYTYNNTFLNSNVVSTSVGAMNTTTTTVDVSGENHYIDIDHRADSSGDVTGSIAVGSNSTAVNSLVDISADAN